MTPEGAAEVLGNLEAESALIIAFIVNELLSITENHGIGVTSAGDGYPGN